MRGEKPKSPMSQLGQVRSWEMERGLAIMGDRGYCVADCQCSELFNSAIDDWIAADHERAGSQLDQVRKDRIEIAFRSGVQ